MDKLIRLVGCVLMIGLYCPTAGVGEQGTSPTATLFELMVSSDIEGAIGPGGFERVQNVDVRLLSHVGNCIAKVMAVGRDWAAARILQIETDKEVDTFGQLIIWAQPKEIGFYELVYKVDIRQKQATTTFNFYDKSALVVPVPNSKEFTELKQRIVEAMGCRP